MFDKKCKEVIKLLDNKIEETQHMFDAYLKEAGKTEGLTEQEIFDDMMLRSGKWAYVDKYIAKLEALCELRREIKKEMGL